MDVRVRIRLGHKKGSDVPCECNLSADVAKLCESRVKHRLNANVISLETVKSKREHIRTHILFPKRPLVPLLKVLVGLANLMFHIRIRDLWYR